MLTILTMNRGNNWVLPDPWKHILIRNPWNSPTHLLSKDSRWKHALTHFMSGYMPLGGRNPRLKKLTSKKGKGVTWTNRKGRTFNALNYSIDPLGEKADVIYYVPKLQNRAANAIKNMVRRVTRRTKAAREDVVKEVLRNKLKRVVNEGKVSSDVFEDSKFAVDNILSYF
jgi:hypothetical protein